MPFAITIIGIISSDSIQIAYDKKTSYDLSNHLTSSKFTVNYRQFVLSNLYCNSIGKTIVCSITTIHSCLLFNFKCNSEQGVYFWQWFKTRTPGSIYSYNPKDIKDSLVNNQRQWVKWILMESFLYSGCLMPDFWVQFPYRKWVDAFRKFHYLCISEFRSG